jgi:cation/acetate symporter
MFYPFAPLPLLSALLVLAAIVALSLMLRGKARSESAFHVADAQVPWFLNGMALAGSFLATALFVGIWGIIAVHGYDGFLYSLGLFAGWLVALLLLAGPARRLGKYTLADLLDPRAESPGVRRCAAICTLLVCLALLIPELAAGGALVGPLLGIPPASAGLFHDLWGTLGILLLGAVLIVIVIASGMASTTWIQAVKAGLIVVVCGVLIALLLSRGFTAKPAEAFPRTLSNIQFRQEIAPQGTLIPPTGPWRGLHYYRMRMTDGSISCWRVRGQAANPPQLLWPSTFTECELVTRDADGTILVNGKQQARGNDLRPLNFINRLPIDARPGRKLGLLSFLSTFIDADVATPASEVVAETVDGREQTTTIYFPVIQSGGDLLSPASSTSLFPGIRSGRLGDRLDFLSVMLAFFCGTAVLPHLLTRYAAARNGREARRSVAVAVGITGLCSLLLIYLGAGAVAAGSIPGGGFDPGNTLSAGPQLARSFGPWMLAALAVMAVIALLGTASGLLLAAAGTLSRDLLGPARAGTELHTARLAVLGVGVASTLLGLVFQHKNCFFLIGWGFTLAACSQLPALTMRLFWKGTTRQGIIASMIAGLLCSLGWLLLSRDAFEHLYDYSASAAAAASPLPFQQPALWTIPLAFLVLIIVSLATRSTGLREPIAPSIEK